MHGAAPQLSFCYSVGEGGVRGATPGETVYFEHAFQVTYRPSLKRSSHSRNWKELVTRTVKSTANMNSCIFFFF